MAKTNLSLGNLYRATQGAARTIQAVSMNAMNASAGTTAAFSSFAIDSVTANLPTYTYIVESTEETATFSFGSAGSLHGTRVGNVAANYSVTFDNANFSVGTATLGSSPSFPITPASIATSNYAEAQSILSMTYADGYNTAATNYNTAATKTLYAVDVYNTINQPDFCLLFGTKIQLSNGTEVNVEDLSIGDEIKAWVPTDLPDETLDGADNGELEWRFYQKDEIAGAAQNVTVSDLTFNFAEGYFSINNGLIKATETHPLYVWCNDIKKYRFKNVGDILPGDKLVMQDETEVVVFNIQLVTADVEIVTVNVENADVYISNGLISHNKGTTTQSSIPASGLRMYLEPAKTASFAAGSLPATGTPVVDVLDMSGYGTGVRPGAQLPLGLANGNPSYNNGASRKERYYSFNGTSNLFYKDTVSNINGGYTQFNTTAYSMIAWVRFTSHPPAGHYCIFNKSTSSDPASRIISLYVYSNGSGTYNVFDGVKNFTSTGASLSLNTWYMISYTAAANGTNVAYIDSTSNGTVSNGANTFTSSGLINIGGNSYENNFYFNGQIGPVLFYNVQLDGTNITRVYNYFSPNYK